MEAGKQAERPVFSVFVDSSLDTHLMLPVYPSDTVSDLRRNIISGHLSCFPRLGDIAVGALMVKQNSTFYHLVDSLLVESAFSDLNGTRFIFAEIFQQTSQSNEFCSLTGRMLENTRMVNRLSSGEQLQSEKIKNIDDDQNRIESHAQLVLPLEPAPSGGSEKEKIKEIAENEQHMRKSGILDTVNDSPLLDVYLGDVLVKDHKKTGSEDFGISGKHRKDKKRNYEQLVEKEELQEGLLASQCNNATKRTKGYDNSNELSSGATKNADSVSPRQQDQIEPMGANIITTCNEEVEKEHIKRKRKKQKKNVADDCIGDDKKGDQTTHNVALAGEQSELKRESDTSVHGLSKQCDVDNGAAEQSLLPSYHDNKKRTKGDLSESLSSMVVKNSDTVVSEQYNNMDSEDVQVKGNCNDEIKIKKQKKQKNKMENHAPCSFERSDSMKDNENGGQVIESTPAGEQTRLTCASDAHGQCIADNVDSNQCDNKNKSVVEASVEDISLQTVKETEKVLQAKTDHMGEAEKGKSRKHKKKKLKNDVLGSEGNNPILDSKNEAQMTDTVNIVGDQVKQNSNNDASTHPLTVNCKVNKNKSAGEECVKELSLQAVKEIENVASKVSQQHNRSGSEDLQAKADRPGEAEKGKSKKHKRKKTKTVFVGSEGNYPTVDNKNEAQMTDNPVGDQVKQCSVNNASTHSLTNNNASDNRNKSVGEECVEDLSLHAGKESENLIWKNSNQLNRSGSDDWQAKTDHTGEVDKGKSRKHKRKKMKNDDLEKSNPAVDNNKNEVQMKETLDLEGDQVKQRGDNNASTHPLTDNCNISAMDPKQSLSASRNENVSDCTEEIEIQKHRKQKKKKSRNVDIDGFEGNASVNEDNNKGKMSKSATLVVEKIKGKKGGDSLLHSSNNHCNDEGLLTVDNLKEPDEIHKKKKKHSRKDSQNNLNFTAAGGIQATTSISSPRADDTVGSADNVLKKKSNLVGNGSESHSKALEAVNDGSVDAKADYRTSDNTMDSWNANTSDKTIDIEHVLNKKEAVKLDTDVSNKLPESGKVVEKSAGAAQFKTDNGTLKDDGENTLETEELYPLTQRPVDVRSIPTNTDNQLSLEERSNIKTCGTSTSTKGKSKNVISDSADVVCHEGDKYCSHLESPDHSSCSFDRDTNELKTNQNVNSSAPKTKFEQDLSENGSLPSKNKTSNSVEKHTSKTIEVEKLHSPIQRSGDNEGTRIFNNDTNHSSKREQNSSLVGKKSQNRVEKNIGIENALVSAAERKRTNGETKGGIHNNFSKGNHKLAKGGSKDNSSKHCNSKKHRRAQSLFRHCSDDSTEDESESDSSSSSESSCQSDSSSYSGNSFHTPHSLYKQTGGVVHSKATGSNSGKTHSDSESPEDGTPLISSTQEKQKAAGDGIIQSRFAHLLARKTGLGDLFKIASAKKGNSAKNDNEFESSQPPNNVFLETQESQFCA